MDIISALPELWGSPFGRSLLKLGQDKALLAMQ